MLPVLDGLLPAPHNNMVLDLVFVLGCWHAYAKLRLHTEQTLASFERVTSDVGTLLRHFSEVTCKAFQTKELPRERAAHIQRAANAPGSATPGGGPKAKGFNLNTYKLHALGDYPQTIRERGTTDNYTTQRVRGWVHPTCQAVITDPSHFDRWNLSIEAPRASIQGSINMTPGGTLAESTVVKRFSATLPRVTIVTSIVGMHLGQGTVTLGSTIRCPTIQATP